MPRARARVQDPAWRPGGSLRVAVNAVVKFTIARINRRDNDYYFRAACPSLPRGSRRFADRRISWSAVVQAFVRGWSGRAGRAHCPTFLSLSLSLNALSKPSLPKLSSSTKCVPTTAVAYFFAHVTLILINLSFLPGRQPLTLLPRPHLHSSPARPVLSSSSFRFPSFSPFLSSPSLVFSVSLLSSSPSLALVDYLSQRSHISFARTHAYVKSHLLSHVHLPSA